jgi:hypothetical protein
MNIDWILWLLAVICFGLGAIGVNFPNRPINWMLLGFMFIGITFLTR